MKLLFVRHSNMMILGWKCFTQAAPSYDIFSLGFHHIWMSHSLPCIHHLYNFISSFVSEHSVWHCLHSTHTRLTALFPEPPGWAGTREEQEAQLSPSDRAMHLVSGNLANYHATVQKQVLTKPMVWSWRFSWRQCVINTPATVELWMSPVYRWLAVAKFSKSTM